MKLTLPYLSSLVPGTASFIKEEPNMSDLVPFPFAL